MGQVRVLLADDSSMAREAIGALLATDARFQVVGEAADGEEALRLARETRPDLILMDINMPRCDGLLATRLIKRELPEVTVVMLTVSDHPGDLFEAIRHGAQGYLLKNLEPKDWMAYLRAFADGEWAMPRDVARRILSEFAGSRPAARTQAAAERPELTDREVEVLQRVARAESNREIADSLHISEHTVKNHIKNILQKLHLKNRVELALYASRHYTR